MASFYISAGQFFFIGLALAFCLYVAVTIAKFYCFGKLSLKKEINIAVLIIYSVFAATLCFFPLKVLFSYGKTPAMMTSNVNLIPFQTLILNIQKLFAPVGTFGDRIGTFLGFLFGNLVIFFPIGFLLPQISKKLRKLSTLTFVIFDLALIKEVVQFFETSYAFAPGKGANTDDLILNVIGGILGFIFIRHLTQKYVIESRS